MADKNLKIFNSRGEYKMSEDDTFKFAKSVALESAEKILDADVKNFLLDKFKNLDDEDIDKISEKFLTKNEPHFIRENLSNGDMICYAEIRAEISLTDLDNFMKNFDVFKLEKKVDEQKKIIDELQNKLELFQKFLPDLIEAGIEVKNNPEDAEAYYNRGIAYADLKNYSQAIEDYTQAIKLNPNYASAYNNRAWTYYLMKNYSNALPDANTAISLNNNDSDLYDTRAQIYKAMGRNAEAEKDFAKERELGYKE